MLVEIWNPGPPDLYAEPDEWQRWVLYAPANGLHLSVTYPVPDADWRYLLRFALQEEETICRAQRRYCGRPGRDAEIAGVLTGLKPLSEQVD